MRILIFGASGFIGTHLVRHAVERGHEVVALCRSGAVRGFAGVVVKWELGTPVPASAMEGVECAIHLAHDFRGGDGARLTRDETLSCIARLRAGGVRRQIFFSSYSAGSHAASLYGRTKQAIENALKGDANVIVIRPGLVLGEGGIYGRIRRWARLLPVIPLPDGGRGQVPVISVERLCRETLAIVEADTPGLAANLFEVVPKSLRELVLEAAGEVGRRPLIFSVPTGMIRQGLRAAAALHLPIPVNADNLDGFIANQLAGHVSTLKD